MKTYIKPVAEIKEFEVTNKIATLANWLAENKIDIGLGDAFTTEFITSYDVTSFNL